MHSLSPPVEQLPPSPVPLRVQCTHRVRQGGYLRRFNPTLNTLLRVQDSLPTGVSMEELIQSDPNLTNYLILSSKLILSRRRQGRRELYSLALDREYFYLRKMTYTDEPSETEWEKVCLLPHQITNPGDEGGLDNGNFQRYYNFFDFLVVHENVEEQYTDTLFGRVETGSNGNRVEVLYVVLAFDRYLTLLRIEQYKNNSDSGNLNFNMSCVSQIRIESSFYNINVSCVVEVQQDHKNSVQLLVGTSKGILFLYEWELDEKRQYRYHLRWEKRALDAFTERYLQTYIQNGGDMRKEKEKGRKKVRKCILSEGISALHLLSYSPANALQLLIYFQDPQLGLCVVDLDLNETTKKKKTIKREREEETTEEETGDTNSPNLTRTTTTKKNSWSYTIDPKVWNKLHQPDQKNKSFFLGKQFTNFVDSSKRQKCADGMSNVSFRPSDPDGGFFLSDRKGNFVKCAFDNDLNAVLVNQLPAETKHDQQETEKESLYCYRHSFADRSRYRIATQQHHKTVLLERQTGQHVAVFLNDYIHYTPEEPFATVYSTNNNHKERMELRWPVDFGFSVQSEGTEASAPPLASDNHTNPWMKCLHYVTSVSLLGDVLLVESNLGLSLIYNVEW